MNENDIIADWLRIRSNYDKIQSMVFLDQSVLNYLVATSDAIDTGYGMVFKVQGGWYKLAMGEPKSKLIVT